MACNVHIKIVGIAVLIVNSNCVITHKLVSTIVLSLLHFVNKLHVTITVLNGQPKLIPLNHLAFRQVII
jgi:hypothetical protein